MKVSQIVDEPDIPPAIGPANSDGMATVEVGAKPVKYHVHKAVLVSTSSSIGCIPDISLDLTLVAHVFGGEPEYASGLVLAKANALGGRILAFGFRRAINNHVIGPYGGITIAPRAYAPAVTWTFENISCERPRPHFLVNDFCENWDAKHDNNDDVEALTQVPRTFIMRAMKRCPLAGESEGDGCFLEHATVAERQSCKHTHPECTAGHDGYGYVGELDD